MKQLIAIVLALWFAPILSAQPAPGSAAELAGTWQGIWHRSDGDARVVLEVKALPGYTPAKAAEAKLYLVDQPGLVFWLFPFQRKGADVFFTFDGPRGSYRATLSSDGNTLTGAWTQEDGPRELNLTRVSRTSQDAWPITQPAPDQLHAYLAAAAARTSLIADGASPFHLIAQIHTSAIKPASLGTLEETWRDPRHWTLTLTYDGGSFTEVHDGDLSYTAGKKPSLPAPRPKNFDGFVDPAPPDMLTYVEDALFRPVHAEVLATRRLSVVEDYEKCGYSRPSEELWKDQSNWVACTRIVAEPEFPGVPDVVPIARTAYEVGSYDLLPYRSGDGDTAGRDRSSESIERRDFTPFAGKPIARWSRVAGFDITITTLEPPVNFDAIQPREPAGAYPTESRRQDASPPSQITYGQFVQPQSGKEYSDFRKLECESDYFKNSWFTAGVEVKLHIDADGKVAAVDILDDPEHVMRPGGAEMLKQVAKSYYRFRASYRGNRLVPVEYVFWTGGCAPS